MRIGDVAAPGALLRTPTATEGASFVRTFGSVQRAFRERRPVPLHQVPERQERRRELEARARRFEEASRSLAQVAPKAEPAIETGSRRPVRLREIETEHRVEDEALAARVAEFAESYNALRTFANAENLDVGDDFGLIGSDERVRDVMRALDELARSLGERSSESGTSLADIGLLVDDAGGLQLDVEALERAIAGDTTSVVELLNASEGGLATSAAAALAPPPPEPATPARGLQGFLGSLASREGRLEARAALLEDVVSALSQGPAGRADEA